MAPYTSMELSVADNYANCTYRGRNKDEQRVAVETADSYYSQCCSVLLENKPNPYRSPNGESEY